MANLTRENTEVLFVKGGLELFSAFCFSCLQKKNPSSSLWRKNWNYFYILPFVSTAPSQNLQLWEESVSKAVCNQKAARFFTQDIYKTRTKKNCWIRRKNVCQFFLFPKGFSFTRDCSNIFLSNSFHWVLFALQSISSQLSFPQNSENISSPP